MRRWMAAGAAAAMLAIASSVSAPAAADTDRYLMVQIGVGGGIARIDPTGTAYQPLIVRPDVYSGG